MDKKEFDLMALNHEFAALLKKHEDDTEVKGKSHNDFIELMQAVDNDEDLICHHASICNAWDELCDKHEGLRESEYSWYAGAAFTEYPDNPWDVYIGTGDELDNAW